MFQETPPDVEVDCDQQFWEYFNMEGTSIVNVTEVVDTTIPAPEQGFVVGVYSALLAAGAVGNVGVFASLMRSRRRKSRVNLLMTHLVVADMIVLFIVIPLEVCT
ncbi:hypothetical protein PYW08_002635 [Mythimna loreyi]|uniref:Uncharacterized protein n=1 Tax=Mythimna loreyi TaxID=667449 RepID=A0ACC2QJI3_9NEOP|nr:hypothetical protein PYW08_002635 [Mythimna loreyi]